MTINYQTVTALAAFTLFMVTALLGIGHG